MKRLHDQNVLMLMIVCLLLIFAMMVGMISIKNDIQRTLRSIQFIETSRQEQMNVIEDKNQLLTNQIDQLWEYINAVNDGTYVEIVGGDL